MPCLGHFGAASVYVVQTLLLTMQQSLAAEFGDFYPVG